MVSEDFCIYKQDGQSIYISRTIKVGGGILIGILDEEELSTAKVTERIVELNFDKQIVSMENLQKTGVKGLATKLIPFRDIIDLQIHPNFHGSNLEFSVYSGDSIMTFKSKSGTERELWMEHFCKILDFNAGVPLQFKNPSQIYI